MGQPTEETSLLGRVKSPTSSTRRKIKKTYDNLGSNAKLTFSVMTIVLLACCCIIVTVAVTHHHMTTRLFTKATRVQNLSDNVSTIQLPEVHSNLCKGLFLILV
jgi:hypothetical protein